MGENSEGISKRTVGGAIGVFFLSYLIMAVVANLVMALMYGAIGTGGSLLGSVIVAVLWKKGTIQSWGAVVAASAVIGFVAFMITVAVAPMLYSMRYGR